MGRKKTDCWSEYGAIEDGGGFKAKRVKCTHCGHELTAHANRMKDHLRVCGAYRDVRPLLSFRRRSTIFQQ